MSYITDFLNDLISLLAEMSPYLLLGFFMAGVLHAFIPKQSISKFLGKNNLSSSFYAALFGVPMPLCSCGVIPTGISLFKNGASKASTNSFLISTPQTGIDSILVSYSLLGLPFAIIRPIIAFVTGVFGGWLTSKVDKEKNVEHSAASETATHKTFPQKIVTVFKYGFVEFLQDISKWLIIGLVLSALISVLVPDNFFANQNYPIIVQMLIMLVVSVPLYICATASVPMAAMLILKGVSPGAALVLLMAGPATNAATITMIGNVLGRKSLMTYLISIIGGALLFGFIIDAFLPIEWFSKVSQIGTSSCHDHILSSFQIISAIALSLLIINGFIQRIRKPKCNCSSQRCSKSTAKEIKVDGMKCNHCKSNVERNLLQIENVDKVDVDLSSKSVKIEGENIDVEQILTIIESLGYKVLTKL